MLRISPTIAKLEERVNRKLDRLKDKGGKKLKRYALLIAVGWYVYGMLINSIILGTASTFPKPGAEPVETIWIWNPIRNLLAIFTPAGIGVTFFCVLMICLITKKGYNWFSGYKFERDRRGFDILPDGTHGTGGWMKRAEMGQILDIGKAADLDGTILGKIKETPEDDDKYSEYVALKKNNHLNEHIIVFGASGAGKSRGFAKPFVLQTIKRRESLILVDPKGEFFESTSQFAREQGAVVRAFNLLDMENSDGFNCLDGIADDKSLVQTIAEVIIKNTSNANERQDFWEKAEMNLLMALLHYVQGQRTDNGGDLRPIDERALGDIYKLLSTESFAQLEDHFAQLPKSHPAQAPYGIFKLANRQIWGNIAIGLGNRLGVFQNELVDKITRYNNIDLELPGKRFCVYYCIISDQDSSLEFLSSMFFSLLFSRLSNYARRSGVNGRLPVKVNMCLDEFCNIGKILDFKKVISTVRSRGINCQIIVQSAAQLSDRYENKEWEEIISNCDTQLFLGVNDQMTAKYISDKCGMVTIRTTTSQIPMQPLFSPIYNTTKPYSQGRSNAQRPLMYPDELLRLDNAQEIILLRGQKPMQLYKIIPDELPSFKDLKTVRVTDYIPAWREVEAQKTKHAPKAGKAPEQPKPVSFSTQFGDQPRFFDDAPDARFAADPPPKDTSQEKPKEEASEKSEAAAVLFRYSFEEVNPNSIPQDAERSG